MKKILITGGAGFIGSHLAEFLLKKNYNITVFDRYNSNNDWGHLENSKFKKDCHKGCPGYAANYDGDSEYPEIQELWQEDNMVCASNGKTYQNK